jgi:hypothetical protein
MTTKLGGDCKELPLNKGLSKEPQGHSVPMAGSHDAYSPMVGGVANGRGLTRPGKKQGAGPNVQPS